MNKKELEEKVISLEEKIRTLEAIEQIKIVQRAYGYYMDNLMYNDAADLFSDDCYAQFGTTALTGRENLKKSFNTFTTDRFEGTKKLFLKFQLMGVVHVEKGCRTAKGRWNMLCLKTDYVDNVLESIISHGVYENEYVNDNGIWKINKLFFNSSFQTTLEDGWAKRPGLSAPGPGVVDNTWRFGYKVPPHFKNPVTGK
jgi:hypothetical protein